MALPNQEIGDLQEVCSHPMALLQCKKFFKQHKHIKLVEDVDTAEVAKRISKENLKGIAAIAPKIAAEIFDLEIIEDEIQTIKDNSTRFVFVQTKKPNNGIDQINKASLKFQLDHKRGSLAAILNVLSDCKMNLTKIQSLPVIETPWKYSFFVDVYFFQSTLFLSDFFRVEIAESYISHHITLYHNNEADLEFIIEV